MYYVHTARLMTKNCPFASIESNDSAKRKSSYHYYQNEQFVVSRKSVSLNIVVLVGRCENSVADSHYSSNLIENGR